MPCCHIPKPAQPVFPASLVPDAQCFSQYVGNGNPTGRAATTTILTSGLHLEMKLWPASGGLPLNKYIPNNARNNSWRAMQIRGCNNTFTPTEQNQLFNGLLAGLPIPSSRVCCLGDYDGWLLDNVIGFRAAGLNPGRNPVAAVANGSTPTTLASVGLAQKPINVFVKYELCWQVAGQWLGGIFHPYAPLQIPDLPQFVCALHAPVDAILVEKLLALPVGQHLMRKGLLKSRIGSPLIQQSSDGSFRPWSKLDCLRTYYGLQLVLRRIAMATWPKGCACSASPDQAIKDCAEWFNEKYRTANICKGKDWIQAACDLGKEVEVIDKTLAVLRGASTSADATQQGSKATECPSEVSVFHEPAMPSDQKSPKPEIIWLNDRNSKTGQLHESALRILAEDRLAARNIGAICREHGCLDLKLVDRSPQFLIEEIRKSAIGRVGLVAFPTDPRHYLPPTFEATHCWSGNGYEGGLDFGAATLQPETLRLGQAVAYLKAFFEVKACQGNQQFNQAWVDAC